METNKPRLKVLKLYSASSMHGDPVTSQIAALFAGYDFASLTPQVVTDIFKFAGVPLQAVDGVEYFGYHFVHSSSGWKTHIFLDSEGELKYKKQSPEGMVFQAFHAEWGIFTLVPV